MPLAMSGAVALAGDRAGTLTAFDAASGAVRWSAHLPRRVVVGAPRRHHARASSSPPGTRPTRPAVRVLDLRTGAPAVGGADRPPRPPHPRSGAAWSCSPSATVNRHARVEARDLATGERALADAGPGVVRGGDRARRRRPRGRGGRPLRCRLAARPRHRRIRWQHDLAHALIATRMALTPRRVVFSSFSGDLFVLDRADGHLVARLGRDRLGGYPVATAAGALGAAGAAARRPCASARGGSTCAGSPEEAGDPARYTDRRPELRPGITHARIPRSSRWSAPVRRRAEEQPRSSSSGPGGRPRPSATGDCTNERDAPWQKQRPSSP